jgi:hypothetical protein
MPIWANTGCCANQNERHLGISNAQPSRVRVPHAFDIRAMMPEALVQRDCPGERRGRELPACATICSRNHPKSRLRLTRMLDLLLFCLFHHTSLPPHISSTVHLINAHLINAHLINAHLFHHPSHPPRNSSTTHLIRQATLPPHISTSRKSSATHLKAATMHFKSCILTLLSASLVSAAYTRCGTAEPTEEQKQTARRLQAAEANMTRSESVPDRIDIDVYGHSYHISYLLADIMLVQVLPCH